MFYIKIYELKIRIRFIMLNPVNIQHFSYMKNFEVLDNKERIIFNIVQKNLSTDLNTGATCRFEEKEITHLNLKEKLSLLWNDFKANKMLYFSPVIATAIVVGVVFALAFFASLIHANLNELYQQILDGLIEISYDGGFSWRPATAAYWYETAFDSWAGYGLLSMVFLFAAFFYFGISISDLHDHLKFIFKDLKHVKAESIEFQLDREAPDLINERRRELILGQEKEFLLDPVSKARIDVAHVNSPRYFQVGRTLYTLDTVIRNIFSSVSESGYLQHPEQERPMTESEQDELLTQLSRVLCITKEDILRASHPYFIPEMPEGGIAHWTESKLDNQLSQMVIGWNAYSSAIQQGIKRQLKDKLFKRNRILNFMSFIPSSVLNLRIPNGPDGGTRLKTIEHEFLNLRLPYRFQ
jgi:hypothetical protein